MRENWVKGRRLLDRGASDQEVADGLEIKLAEWLDTRQACSGAPLELKDTVTVTDKRLEAKEDDRLTKLENSVDKAWSRLGSPFARNLAAHFRFDHLLREHAADSLVAMSEAVFDGRDVCYIDLGIPQSSLRSHFVQAVSVEQDEQGSLVIHAHDLGEGRVQRSFFENDLSDP
jgi:hypothetical protein